MIHARIWNLSPNAPVAGLPVIFSYLEYGVGTQPIPIGTIAQTTVNLGVRGQGPAFTIAAWTTPAAPGHYCIQVHLQPFEDANFDNNLGQLNTHVVAAQSPAATTFALRNASDVRRKFNFEADAYVLGELPPCPPSGFPVSASAEIRAPAIPPRHLLGAAPLPQGWTVQCDPTEPTLEPGEQITVTATIVPPSEYHGSQTVNINTFAPDEFTGERALTGGVTLKVLVP